MKYVLILSAVVLLGLGCSSSKQNANAALKPLQGTWELNYITGPSITLEGLYPGNKPMLSFDVPSSSIAGNTGCNSFGGPLNAVDNKIIFPDAMAMTKMACTGDGENVFLGTLKKIDNWKIDANNKLNLNSGEMVLMKFSKQ